nr:ATP-binding protein [Jeotgalibacillus malaysiensis]
MAKIGKKLLNAGRIPQASSNRCQNKHAGDDLPACNRVLMIDESGKEYCMYCDHIMQEDQQLAAAAKENARKERMHRLQDHFNLYSIIPPRLKKAGFDNYKPANESQAKALNDCRRFAENFPKNLNEENDIGLLLHGMYGLGKSHLAVAIAKRVIELGSTYTKPDGTEGITVIFINLPELVTKIKATWRKDSDISESKILDMLKSCDLLIIDELGGAMNKQDEQGQSWLNDMLFQITDARQGRNTIYTSNPDPDELQQHVSKKIYERIFANIHILEFTGKSYRLNGTF